VRLKNLDIVILFRFLVSNQRKHKTSLTLLYSTTSNKATPKQLKNNIGYSLCCREQNQPEEPHDFTKQWYLAFLCRILPKNITPLKSSFKLLYLHPSCISSTCVHTKNPQKAYQLTHMLNNN
jgi:hypothetical protein